MLSFSVILIVQDCHVNLPPLRPLAPGVQHAGICSYGKGLGEPVWDNLPWISAGSPGAYSKQLLPAVQCLL